MAQAKIRYFLITNINVNQVIIIIITLFKSQIILVEFKSQIILVEHKCSTNWGDCKSNK